jgi:hypothetical protein
MAVRVRKLAKELERSPADVLGLLLAIGFPRYRSPDDMVPDDLVDRVKRASKVGVRPVPVQVLEVERPATLGNREPPRADRDLMSRLVPGVIPVDKRPPPKAVRAPTLPPTPAVNTDTLHEERSALMAEREALRQERELLATERAIAVERQTRLDTALVEAREAADAHRAAVEALNIAPALPVQDAPKLPSLVDLLTARGLRGRDELERAVAALASHRVLGEALTALLVADVPAVERLLRERLVLVQSESSPVPTGAAAVVVGPQRAEAQDMPDLQRALGRLGERLLLHGLRRVAVIGGRPSFQKVLRDGIDPRIEIRFGPPAVRGRAEAENDVQRTDLVVLWGVQVEAPAREVYESSRAVLVEVQHVDLAALLAAIDVALESS